MSSKFDKMLILCAVSTFLRSCKKLTFRYGTFSIIKGKIGGGGAIFHSSLLLRNSLKHFNRCTSFGAVDYDIGKKAIFVRFFLVGPKIAVLGQKLQFSGYKLPF